MKVGVIRYTLLVIAVAFLLTGIFYHRDVRDLADEIDAAMGIFSSSKVSDREMVIDATFSGVRRDAEGLYSTYDRHEETRIKRPCPT